MSNLRFYESQRQTSFVGEDTLCGYALPLHAKSLTKALEDHDSAKIPNR